MTVAETNVPGNVPTGAGGSIIHPAIYYLTKWENYQTPYGPTGTTRKVAFQFGASVSGTMSFNDIPLDIVYGEFGYTKSYDVAVVK